MQCKPTYSIVRFFQRAAYETQNRHYIRLSDRTRGDQVVLAKGLTLEAAQEWCSDPETSSSTAVSPENLELTSLRGQWFDGYRKEL